MASAVNQAKLVIPSFDVISFLYIRYAYSRYTVSVIYSLSNLNNNSNQKLDVAYETNLSVYVNSNARGSLYFPI
jgi:hypothetical protein